MVTSVMTLAALGGERVRSGKWPCWPSADDGTAKALMDVMHSGRWAISGAYMGRPSREQEFAGKFADYCDSDHCVVTTSGTSALTIALLAMGIGPGDEVLVPGLTWVACASATACIGAVPVLTDIDQGTLAMSALAAERNIGERTRAIMLVHPFCRIADLDAFVALSERTGIPLIEDCSQAHGATWRGRKVGSFGLAGCFSMQQSKVLTSGEGGAVVTNDLEIAKRMEQLRADGRVYAENPAAGRLELKEIGAIMGQNLCLSEFQSAILIDRLGHLDAQNARRSRFVARLESLLAETGYASFLDKDPRATDYTYYNLAMRIDRNRFGSVPIDTIAAALSAELDVQISPVYRPLNAHPLYCPSNSPRLRHSPDMDRIDPSAYVLPNARQAREEVLTIPNWIMLDEEESAADIVAALDKVSRNACLLEQIALPSKGQAF